MQCIKSNSSVETTGNAIAGNSTSTTELTTVIKTEPLDNDLNSSEDFSNKQKVAHQQQEDEHQEKAKVMLTSSKDYSNGSSSSHAPLPHHKVILSSRNEYNHTQSSPSTSSSSCSSLLQKTQNRILPPAKAYTSTYIGKYNESKEYTGNSRSPSDRNLHLVDEHTESESLAERGVEISVVSRSPISLSPSSLPLNSIPVRNHHQQQQQHNDRCHEQHQEHRSTSSMPADFKNNLSPDPPQIIITKVVSLNNSSGSSSGNNSSGSGSGGHHQSPSRSILMTGVSPPPLSIPPSQHQQQQVRVIRDGRFYDENRRNAISPTTTITALRPGSNKYSSPSMEYESQQQSQRTHLNSNRTLTIQDEYNSESVTVAKAEIVQPSSSPSSSSSTASRKLVVSRHVNVISSNKINPTPSSSLCNNVITISGNNNNNNHHYNNSSCSTVVSNNISGAGGGNREGVNSPSIFRTPVVSSSSKISVTASSTTAASNTTMRPPPPPPPPKIKNSSSATSSSSSIAMNEEPSSSIPDLEFDGTTVLCRVCGDKASGFHYGVHSCEGCKGFFRRSIQQKIQYRPCTKNQQCSILRINRNRCQYCRLKKCIAVGMSRDAVRFGRVPKREKARILAAMQQSTQNRGQQRALASELDDQPRLLAAVLRAHMETCEFTREKVSAMRQRARECPSYSMPTLLACPLNPAPELQSEQEFSQRFAHVIRGVIDFAGMIPGFQLLTQDDKFTLLKAGLFDALFVRLICMFDSSINSIICLNGQVMRRDAIQNGANARFLVDSTFNFAERMNSMNLTDAEIGLFCAIVLITPDRPGLRNIELIEKMYTRLKACLQSVISQNRPDQPEFMSELLKTLPDLRTLSTLHTEKLVVFRTEHKELLRQQMWTMDDDQPSKSPGSSWDDNRMEDVVKSPLGSVSSTESGDLEYSQSSLASSAPLLAATLSGTCPLRHRANSGSSAEDIDIVGTHAHLTQNGLTITPVVRPHSHGHHIVNSSSRYRKLDSPTDSGIESGNEKAESTKTVSSGGGSSCSSPRSTADDALDEQQQRGGSQSSTAVKVESSINSGGNSANSSSNNNTGTISLATKRPIVEDMPVLKRVLQAPPLYDTNSLMDEAYKPHKKFRALRHREFETAEADANVQQSTSTSTPVINTPHNSNGSSNNLNNHHSHQSQLHMHLTRNNNSTNNNSIHSSNSISSNNNINNNNSSSNNNNTSSGNSYHHNTTQHSSLSSTHSVLAKSLMEEPRMTPEQMKRTDIIQNYIMRDQPSLSSSTNNGLVICASSSLASAHRESGSNCPYSNPPASSSLGGASSSSPTNPNCSSPSTTTVTLSSPPPLPSHSMRWQGHSVITTTTVRQQSVSPNGLNACPPPLGSNNNGSSNGSYFQSPHSTSVSPPRPSPSAQSPRLLELQVDIADSQQPLNLSKKSPTPPPSKAAILLRSQYPVAADVTVTATSPSGASGAQSQMHKVLLEA